MVEMLESIIFYDKIWINKHINFKLGNLFLLLYKIA